MLFRTAVHHAVCKSPRLSYTHGVSACLACDQWQGILKSTRMLDLALQGYLKVYLGI